MYHLAPTNTQSFNKYSYVWNNPLKYVDPSGWKVNDYEGAEDVMALNDDCIGCPDGIGGDIYEFEDGKKYINNGNGKNDNTSWDMLVDLPTVEIKASKMGITEHMVKTAINEVTDNMTSAFNDFRIFLQQSNDFYTYNTTLYTSSYSSMQDELKNLPIPKNGIEKVVNVDMLVGMRGVNNMPSPTWMQNNLKNASPIMHELYEINDVIAGSFNKANDQKETVDNTILFVDSVWVKYWKYLKNSEYHGAKPYKLDSFKIRKKD